MLTTFCKLYAKGRWVFLGLLLVVAVATVLITPDPTDDIQAFLCQDEASPILVLASAPDLTWLSHVSLPLAFIHRPNLSSSLHPMTPDLLRVICVWRC